MNAHIYAGGLSVIENTREKKQLVAIQLEYLKRRMCPQTTESTSAFCYAILYEVVITLSNMPQIYEGNRLINKN